jgi:phosphonate metabolism protein/1,5-bisphosphokinase (PRPP-forming) PhnN
VSRDNANSGGAVVPGKTVPGLLIVIAGPSGAGKDSLLSYAQKVLEAESGLLFVRRVITRQPDGETEDHDSLTPSEFLAVEQQGLFAVTWEAHGLRYGVPSSALQHVSAGGTAVLNGSRSALPAIRAAFPSVTGILVTARPEILAARLAGRRRESAEEIVERLGRTISADDNMAYVIENNDKLETAGERLAGLIQALAGNREHALSGDKAEIVPV